MRFLVITIILCAICTITSAQKVLKQLTTEDGLSETLCYDVYQDSKEYIWIGTSTGANKYDGKDVMIFDRSVGLLSDDIYDFFEDSKGRVWVNNLNSEPLFIEDNIVHNRYTDPYLNEIRGGYYFRTIKEDKYNRVWFGHIEGYMVVLDRESTFIIDLCEYVDTTRLELYGTFPMDDEIIIITSDYIMSIDIDTFEPVWTMSLDRENAYFRKEIVGDKLYLFDLFEAKVVDLNKKEIKTIERFDGNPAIYDCRVVYDELLISTAEGVSVLRDSIIVNYSLHHSLDSIAVSAVHEDVHGDLWIATRDNGIYTYYNGDIEKSKYVKYCNTIFLEDFLGDSVFIIQNDWKVNLLVEDELIWSKQLDKLDENRFNNIFLKNGELWIVDKYQIHIDVGGDYETFSTYSRKVFYMSEDNSYYWIGNKGLSKLDDIDYIFEYNEMREMTICDPDYYRHFDVKNPYDMEMDNDNKIWLGSEEGLYVVQDNEISQVDDPIVSGSIKALSLKDDVLIGINFGKGIFHYNIENGESGILSREHGLPTNHFTRLEMSGNDIWASHANGICLMRYEDNGLKSIKNFGREHGIPSGRIIEFTIVDDVCQFVVNDKVYSIRPKQFVNDTLEVLMDTTELIYFTDESRTIDFDCINYTFGDKIQYEYRLMPHDTIWEKAFQEKVDLKYIPAGEYKLEVRAQHPLNLISPIKRKSIHIKEKWYNENYFQGIVFLFLGFILFFLFRIKALSFNTANFKHWVAAKIQKYFVKEERNSFNLKDINGVVHLLKTDDIKFIKSSGNYLEYHTDNKKYVSRMTMSNAVEKFKIWTDLERVHRSYMVNFSMIDAIDRNFLKVGNVNIPFTDRYKETIERKLQL